MEFIIKAKDGAIPCSVTVDEENGRYTIRNADTSGEVFQNKAELINYVETKWNSNIFENEADYSELVSMLKDIDHLEEIY